MAKSSNKAEPTVEEDKALLARAQTTLRPSANAAAVIADFGKPFGDQDFTALMVQLMKSSEALKENDLSRCEAMLFTQAHALQSIFMNLARRSAMNLGEHMKATEMYMRLALKAQSQCVRTLEVLGTLKNPPNVAFVKQANIAHGHQQVNNGAAAPAQAPSTLFPEKTVNNLSDNETEPLYLGTHAHGKTENAPNELLSPLAHSPP
ncbi:hypothetical protein [Methylomagnum sp.]